MAAGREEREINSFFSILMITCSQDVEVRVRLFSTVLLVIF